MFSCLCIFQRQGNWFITIHGCTELEKTVSEQWHVFLPTVHSPLRSVKQAVGEMCVLGKVLLHPLSSSFPFPLVLFLLWLWTESCSANQRVKEKGWRSCFMVKKDIGAGEVKSQLLNRTEPITLVAQTASIALQLTNWRSYPNFTPKLL